LKPAPSLPRIRRRRAICLLLILALVLATLLFPDLLYEGFRPPDPPSFF
jgi:hypothetical protein